MTSAQSCQPSLNIEAIHPAALFVCMYIQYIHTHATTVMPPDRTLGQEYRNKLRTKKNKKRWSKIGQLKKYVRMLHLWYHSAFTGRISLGVFRLALISHRIFIKTSQASLWSKPYDLNCIINRNTSQEKQPSRPLFWSDPHLSKGKKTGKEDMPPQSQPANQSSS